MVSADPGFQLVGTVAPGRRRRVGIQHLTAMREVESMPGPVGKVRKPLAVLLLSIVTLGIYGLYWDYKTFSELKDYSGSGIGGVLGLVLGLFCGIIVIFLLPSEVANLYTEEGQKPPVSAVTGLWILLPIVGGLIWLWKVQGRLNDFWTAKGAQ
jgi:hypothetical protein